MSLWDSPGGEHRGHGVDYEQHSKQLNGVSRLCKLLQNTPPPPQPATEDSPGSGVLGQAEASARRIAIELERELTSVRFGRRDAQWALQSALQTARHLIYIETPGFCSTTAHHRARHLTGLKGYAADLIETLKAQMAKMPGLRVVICVNKAPDFAAGYEGMASFEVQDRLSIVQHMPPALTSPPVVLASSFSSIPSVFRGVSRVLKRTSSSSTTTGR